MIPFVTYRTAYIKPALGMLGLKCQINEKGYSMMRTTGKRKGYIIPMLLVTIAVNSTQTFHRFGSGALDRHKRVEVEVDQAVEHPVLRIPEVVVVACVVVIQARTSTHHGPSSDC
jgi:uncharacterized membrane protein (DUF4010 family)